MLHARNPNARVVVVTEDNPTTDYLREAIEKLTDVKVASKRRTVPRYCVVALIWASERIFACLPWAIIHTQHNKCYMIYYMSKMALESSQFSLKPLISHIST